MTWYKERMRHSIAARKGWRGTHSPRSLAIDRGKQAQTVHWSREDWEDERDTSDLAGYDTKRFKEPRLVARRRIPAFIAPNMKEYGPFEPGEKVKAPKRVRVMLASRKLAGKTKNPYKYVVRPQKIKESTGTPKIRTTDLSKREEQYLRFVQKQQAKMYAVPLEDVRVELNMDKDSFKELTNQLSRKGDIYQPRHNIVRLTGAGA